MKNKLIPISLLMMGSLLLTGCDFLKDLFGPAEINLKNSGDDTTTSYRNNGGQGQSSSMKNTSVALAPQSWLDLFDFKNVTLRLTTEALGRKISYYKWLEGKVYYKDSDSDSFVIFNDILPTDGYKENHQAFTFKEEENQYEVIGWKRYSDSDWLYDVTIQVYDGKITGITDICYYASVTFGSQFDFYNYDCTTLED